MPNYTATYSEFCDLTGLSRSNKEVSEAQFNARVHIAENWLTRLIELNSIDVNTYQTTLNNLGSLVILRNVMATPDMSIVARAGGGAGAVTIAMKNSVNQAIDELMEPLEWSMYESIGFTDEYEN